MKEKPKPEVGQVWLKRAPGCNYRCDYYYITAIEGSTVTYRFHNYWGLQSNERYMHIVQLETELQFCTCTVTIFGRELKSDPELLKIVKAYYERKTTCQK